MLMFNDQYIIEHFYIMKSKSLLGRSSLDIFMSTVEFIRRLFDYYGGVDVFVGYRIPPAYYNVSTYDTAPSCEIVIMDNEHELFFVYDFRSNNIVQTSRRSPPISSKLDFTSFERGESYSTKVLKYLDELVLDNRISLLQKIL